MLTPILSPRLLEQVLDMMHHKLFIIQHHILYPIYHAPYTIHHTPCIIYHIPYTMHHTPYTIYHADFEEACADLFARVTSPIEAALRMANLSLSDIQNVEILGGG
ncbi:hypothetical protein EON63_04810 [archaeon]|nr:MAG: hypothetical protein EON63_04810 [archaeon]